MVVAKKDSKSLDVNCRLSSVLTGMDRHKMSTSKKLFLRLVRVHNLFLANNDEESALAIRGYIEKHSIALTGLDRHRKRVVMGLFRRLAHVHAEFVNVGNYSEASRVRRYIRRVKEEFVSVSTVPNKIFIQFLRERIRINSVYENHFFSISQPLYIQLCLLILILYGRRLNSYSK